MCGIPGDWQQSLFCFAAQLCRREDRLAETNFLFAGTEFGAS
jgi:hypothetical protein